MSVCRRQADFPQGENSMGAWGGVWPWEGRGKKKKRSELGGPAEYYTVTSET